MAPGEAWLTPHHHSLGASPICSPGAASRRVLHTSSHSKGCHLEDRKRCALSPLGCRRQHLLPWGYTAKGLGERRGVSSTAERPVWSSSGASLPHVTAGLRLQTVLPCGVSLVQRIHHSLLPSRAIPLPQACLHTARLLYQWHGSFS